MLVRLRDGDLLHDGPLGVVGPGLVVGDVVGDAGLAEPLADLLGERHPFRVSLLAPDQELQLAADVEAPRFGHGCEIVSRLRCRDSIGLHWCVLLAGLAPAQRVEQQDSTVRGFIELGRAWISYKRGAIILMIPGIRRRRGLHHSKVPCDDLITAPVLPRARVGA